MGDSCSRGCSPNELVLQLHHQVELLENSFIAVADLQL